MSRPQVLIVDDEETIRHILLNVIAWNGCEAREAATAEEALALLSDFVPDVALLDIVLPGRSGLDLLKEIKQRCPETEVVMMTSHASAETALNAMQKGAYSYLQKPFENLDEIWTTLQRALEKRSLGQKKNSLLQAQEVRNRELSTAVPLIEGGADADDAASYAELLDFFMDMVSDELRVDDACILLVDEKAGELRSVCRRTNGTRDPTPLRIDLEDGMCGKVARTGVPFVLVHGAAARAAHRKNGGGPVPGADLGPFSSPVALCVPIKSDAKVLGVFASASRTTGEPFAESDAGHVVSLGAQLAVAIDGARRAARLERAYASLKETQDQLIRTERIKAIGQMAAGVAHDFNNALSVILARAEFIHKGLESDTLDRAKAISDLQTIIKTALQGAETIKRIQDYTRIRKDQPRAPVDLNAAVRDAVEITKPKWKQEVEARGRTIAIQTDLPKVPLVTGNIYELTQVVENLIFNAVEAMPEGGRLGFKTLQDDGSVILEVSDTGTGMDEKTRERLFEPFFTTKESGQGLGTSIVYGIITRHQGAISVQSKPGSGTTFRICLPPHVFAPKESAAPGEEAPKGERKVRILLVEDEESVRSAYQEALTMAGHEVAAAESGEQALARFGKGRFDLVITDLSLGGMSGYEVAKQVKGLDPSTPVVLLSGWAIGQQADEVREAGIETVLVKPCPIQVLRDAIQRALQARSGSGD
jgi:signal transduction histidine kinase/DNA-binding response OmpR family regulator